MTPEQAKEIRDFSTNWIRKVVGKKKDYKQKLVDVIEDLFPEDIEEWDHWSILGCENWDYGEEYIENGRRHWWCSLSSILGEVVERENYFCLTEKAKNDVVCTIRIATDLLISESGGVIGYTIGDLKKVYGGVIPESICKRYGNNLNAVNEEEGIWL